jgi:sirohydrochlorin ferrochelatase
VCPSGPAVLSSPGPGDAVQAELLDGEARVRAAIRELREWGCPDWKIRRVFLSHGVHGLGVLHDELGNLEDLKHQTIAQLMGPPGAA